MDNTNIILSFFKENKVDYALKYGGEFVLFPCLNCGSTTEICTVTTYWTCDLCNHNGNLIVLIKHFKNGHKLTRKIYNPKKEKLKINDLFQILKNKNPTIRTELLDIENRILNLILYYEKKGLKNSIRDNKNTRI